MLGKEFDDVLQTAMVRTLPPSVGQTTVPMVVRVSKNSESFDCPITNIFGTGGTSLKEEA
jgi:hypothetical protein